MEICIPTPVPDWFAPESPAAHQSDRGSLSRRGRPAKRYTACSLCRIARDPITIKKLAESEFAVIQSIQAFANHVLLHRVRIAQRESAIRREMHRRQVRTCAAETEHHLPSRSAVQVIMHDSQAAQ